MQAHQFHPACWEEDVQYAKACLDTLEYCGEVDEVAAQLYTLMAPIFQDLADYIPMLVQSPASTPPCDAQNPSYLFRIPQVAPSGPSGLAAALYEMLSRPFRETEGPEYGDVSSVGALWNY